MMRFKSLYDKLVQTLKSQCHNRQVLLLADDILTAQHWQQLSQCPNLIIISNRSEHIALAQQHNILCSSEDFYSIAPDTQQVWCAINKEKQLTHHWVKLAYHQLSNRGELFVFGKKNQGIKSLHKWCMQQFGDSHTYHKNSTFIAIQFCHSNTKSTASSYSDNSYHTLITVSEGGQSLYSKPGIFGHAKIDTASQLLTGYIAQNNAVKTGKKILDLGCGYGYLAHFCLQYAPSLLVALDNNRVAVSMCERNLKNAAPTNQAIKVLWQSAEQKLDTRFDYIICNPPFHCNFESNYQLTDIFICAIKNALTKNGCCLLVANEFIPIVKTVNKYKLLCQMLQKSSGFKIWQLKNE